MVQRYSPDQIQDWSWNLRVVANGLSNTKLANHFYGVYLAFGPEDKTESDLFALDKHHLELLAKQEGKTSKKVMRELIESLGVVIREGDGFVSQSEWDGGLKNYLCELKEHLETRLAEDLAKHSKTISVLCRVAVYILFFLFGVLAFGNYEPRILLALGCLLSAIILAFYSWKKEKK